MQKLRCDKLVGQVSRLQTDYDRLSLRNDLGLTKPELDQIAKRMAPPTAKVTLFPSCLGALAVTCLLLVKYKLTWSRCLNAPALQT